MAITSFSPDERIQVYVTVSRKKILKNCNFTRGRKITFNIWFCIYTKSNMILQLKVYMYCST